MVVGQSVGLALESLEDGAPLPPASGPSTCMAVRCRGGEATGSGHGPEGGLCGERSCIGSVGDLGSDHEPSLPSRWEPASEGQENSPSSLVSWGFRTFVGPEVQLPLLPAMMG